MTILNYIDLFVEEDTEGINYLQKIVVYPKILIFIDLTDICRVVGVYVLRFQGYTQIRQNLKFSNISDKEIIDLIYNSR